MKDIPKFKKGGVNDGQHLPAPLDLRHSEIFDSFLRVTFIRLYTRSLKRAICNVNNYMWSFAASY